MSREKLRKHQWDAKLFYLDALARRCRRRFIEAAVLIGADLEQWPDLGRIGGPRVNCDVGHLIPFWDELCAHYVTKFEQMQTSMLNIMEDNAAGVLTPEAIFSQWIHWQMWPRMTEDDGVVRAVLRAVRCLPSRNPERAAEYLSIYLEHLELNVWLAAQNEVNGDSQ